MWSRKTDVIGSCDLCYRAATIKDINEHSNLQVSWTQRKSGRRVTHLTFYFSEKEPVETKPKEKEKRIGGVKVSEIEKLARPGESWEEAARRIKAGQKKTATENG